MKKPSDDSFDFSDFSLTGSNPGTDGRPGNSAPPTPEPVEASAEAQEAQAAVAASGPGGPGSTVAVTGSSGFTINLEFDAAAMAAPASFRAGIEQAAAMLSAALTDPITVNISIDYSGTGGGAAGGPTGGYYEPYTTVRADLVNNASPGDTTFNSLPTGSSIAGQTQVAVWYAQLKEMGLISATGTEVDGSATFATDINSNLLVGVALHELTHAMGRVPYGPTTGQTTPTPQPDIFDFFRFTSAGNILIDGDATAPAAYFSLNNGVTKIADYGQTSDSSDFLNSGLAGPTDPFDEFYSSSTQQQLTALDLKQLDALGFHLAANAPQTVIEAFGSTKLVEVGSNFFLDPVAGGTGPELKYSGAAFVAGSTWGGWAPIGAEAISGGYEVAFKTGADSYAVWDTDTNGNLTTIALGTTSGSSTALESLETSFHQDLNGDGTIGIPAAPGSTTIEAYGSTALV
ncbi:MAG TPA: NF038122 family metalloprotease, partial [Opitutaceae bacterium]|nr:NF038122 family metalloprotease [Opitutaceae bacterium]